MHKEKRYNTGHLYFSERIMKAMKGIFDVVEAPMGYGKTTAVREYLENSDANLLWQRVYDDSKITFWNEFCYLIDGINKELSRSIIQLGFPDDSVSLQEALKIIREIELSEKTVLVIDDYHLINSTEVNLFIEFLVVNEIDNLHIVLTARFIDLPKMEQLALKGYLYHISKEIFELMPKDIGAYYKLCEISNKASEVHKLYCYTEGWISALYLLMFDYKEEGRFAAIGNIYKLVEKAVYMSFSNEIKGFLLNVCVFKSFSLEQAIHMWQRGNTAVILEEITIKNSLIKYDLRTKTYQIHNIFTKFLFIMNKRKFL